jgi:hypothetical protein
MVKVPAKPTSLLGRLTWRLHNPLVALLAAAALFISFHTLPLRGQDTYVDRLIGRPIQVEMSTGTNSVWLVRHTGDPNVEFEVIDSNQQSWDRLGRLITERPADVLGCSYSVRIIQRGMWFPSNELAKRDVIITSMMPDESMNNFAPGELGRARKAYLAWLASPTGGNAPKEAALVADGDTLEQRMVYPAVLKNSGTVIAAILLLLSLRGMPEYLRVWRAGRRIKKGRCGVCKYDLSATPAINGEKQCPECGAMWPTA